MGHQFKLDAFVMFGVLGFVFFYVVAQLNSRDKDGHRLTQIWRRYAQQHGDSVWAPGRFEWLLPWAAGDANAKLEGIRNGISFTVEITAYDPTHGGGKDTSFRAIPTWLPPESGIALSRGEVPSSWSGSHEPTLSRYQVGVYAHPPQLAEVFDDPAADAILRAFAKLPWNIYLTGWRSESHAKRYGDPAIIMVSMADWCDDPNQLDTTIEVVTRLCALQPNWARQPSLGSPSFGSPSRR